MMSNPCADNVMMRPATVFVLVLYQNRRAAQQKKVEIRDFFAESRKYLDLASVVHRLHFGTIFLNFTRTSTRTLVRTGST